MSDKHTDDRPANAGSPSSTPAGSLRKGVAEAIDAMFALCRAIHEHELSTLDLAAGCQLAIESGHDMALIQLEMMQWAISQAKPSNVTDTPSD